MVQWSPDTTPADLHGRGGYDYRDSHVKGFSLTHLSGAGCSIYGDFPFLPTTEPIEASPAGNGSSLDGHFQPGFSHAAESAGPGHYSVRLNPVHGAGIDVGLTATTRTGMARFTFPRNPHSSLLVNAGGSAQADDFAAVQIDPGRPRDRRHRLQRRLLQAATALPRLHRRGLQPSLPRRRHLGRKRTPARRDRSQRQPDRRRPTRRPPPTPAPTRPSTPAATGSSSPASASPSSASKTRGPTSRPKTPASASRPWRAAPKAPGTSGWGRSVSPAGPNAR